MTDDRDINVEPAPDRELRSALTDAFGAQPADTDWSAISRSIRSAAIFRLRARARVAPWWEQVGPLARKLVPAGALAAAAAVALAMVTPGASDSGVTVASSGENRDAVVDAVVAPNGGATASSATGPVDDEWLWNATAVAHASEGQ